MSRGHGPTRVNLGLFSYDESLLVHHLGKAFTTEVNRVVGGIQGKEGIIFDEGFE